MSKEIFSACAQTKLDVRVTSKEKLRQYGVHEWQAFRENSDDLWAV